MKLEFDRVTDAAYSEISPAEVATTKAIEPGIIADDDADGHLVGIEVLSASKRARPPPLDQVASIGRSVEAPCLGYLPPH